jgi:hypothetical protein
MQNLLAEQEAIISQIRYYRNDYMCYLIINCTVIQIKVTAASPTKPGK